MHGDGKRATEIISRIRALARKALPQPGWLDLNQAIWEITAMLRGELHRSGVSLQTQLATNLPALCRQRRSLLPPLALIQNLCAWEILTNMSETLMPLETSRMCIERNRLA
jgi:hypothetical protein